MPLLLDTLLISRSDFKDFRDMSQNIPQDRLDVFIRESQVREMRSFLGDELYLKLILDYDAQTDTFTEQRFIDLFFGIDYTVGAQVIRFNGYKSALIMYSYRRIMDHQQVNLTRYGIKSMQTDLSEDVLAAKIRTEKIDSDAMAKVYQADAVKFLSSSAAAYPEYRSQVTSAEKTGFKFFKV